MSIEQTPDRPKRCFRASRRRIKEHVVLIKHGRMFLLSKLADAVWRQIDGVRTSEEIAASLSPELDLSSEDALVVTRAAIEKFAQQGLLAE